MRFVSCLVSFCTAACLLGGCRKDLCYNHDEHSYAVKVQIVSEWEQAWERKYGRDWEQEWRDEWEIEYEDLCPDMAGGIRGVVYDADGTYTENNISAEGERLPMDEGIHSLLFYNNDTEYIVFSDIPSSAAACASTRTRTRGGFSELHAGERTINPPDMLYGTYVEEYEATKTLQPVKLPIILRPLVYTYYIRYEFSKGLEAVSLARGALAGMAEFVYLQNGHTSETSATILYDNCTIESYGVQAVVKSFGIPGFPDEYYSASRSPRNYSLSLEVRMKNGKYKNFEFDVTEQIEKQPRGGVIIVRGLEITDEESGGGGGFEVGVNDWGEYEDIEFPL